MGRSQRHKVLEQGISASQETWAEGVGEPWPGTTYNVRGLPEGSGPGSRQTGDDGEPLDEGEVQLPLALGSPGGPLQGSAVQSATSEGGTQPDIEGGGEPEPPEPEPAPEPTLTSLDPDSAYIGDPDVEMFVNGTGFDDTCVIVFNNGEEPTTLVSDTQLMTIVKPTTASGPWALPVVVKYGDNYVTKNQLTFTFLEPESPPSEPLLRE